MLNEQAKLSDNEDPKLLANDILDKTEELKREVNYLVSKIKYFKPKSTKKPETKAPENETGEKPQESGDESKSDQQQNAGDEQQQQQQEDFFDSKDEQSSTDAPKSGNKKNIFLMYLAYFKISNKTILDDDTTTSNPEL